MRLFIINHDRTRGANISILAPMLNKKSAKIRINDDQTPFVNRYTNSQIEEQNKNDALNRMGDEISKIMQLFVWSFIFLFRTLMFISISCIAQIHSHRVLNLICF